MCAASCKSPSETYAKPLFEMPPAGEHGADQALAVPPDLSSPQTAARHDAVKRVDDGSASASSVWDAIGRCVDLYTPQECQNYFVATGYDAF